MSWERKALRIALILSALWALGPSRVRAQGPTLAEPGVSDPGSVRSSLGPIPGAGGNPFGATPGTDPAFLGGRPGPSFPRVPSSITTPGGAGMPPA
ncbi:MAG: TolC family protein, partial [Planctomycetia bacterium]|nr:TolC family protein [Planctomycetia bacterium]